MAGGDLDITQGHPRVERCHDEGGAQHVGVDDAEAGPLADGADPAVCRPPVESLAVVAMQDRALTSLAQGEVDRVRATRGTRGINAGLLPFPMIRSVRWPRSKPRSSASVAQACSRAVR